jgi:hypothetical protein
MGALSLLAEAIVVLQCLYLRSVIDTVQPKFLALSMVSSPRNDASRHAHYTHPMMSLLCRRLPASDRTRAILLNHELPSKSLPFSNLRIINPLQSFIAEDFSIRAIPFL